MKKEWPLQWCPRCGFQTTCVEVCVHKSPATRENRYRVRCAGCKASTKLYKTWNAAVNAWSSGEFEV